MSKTVARRRATGGSDISRARNSLIGLLALALAAGLVALTGGVLTGSIRTRTVPASAEFSNCGQGLREGGDVKLRGVLVGRIGAIARRTSGECRVELLLSPQETAQIPSDVGAQIRAKTVFGEKWVELLLPQEPAEIRIAAGDVIPAGRTIDPLEVESILDVALPLLEAVDPEALAGVLEALAEGFVGHEDAAIRSIEAGIDALAPLDRDRELLAEALGQLADAAEVLDRVSPDLLASMENLTTANRFAAGNRQLIGETLHRAPELLGEVSSLFETNISEMTRLVDRGATVIGILAARTDDIDRLLGLLPKFGSYWIRNLRPTCRHRQLTDEPGKSVGDPVDGRCWRVHNIFSQSRGAYGPGAGPKDEGRGAYRGGDALRHLLDPHGGTG